MHNTDRTQQYMESGEFNAESFPQGEYPQEFAGGYQGEYQSEYQPEYQPGFQGEYAGEYQGEHQPEYQGEFQHEYQGDLEFVNPMTGEVNADTELAVAAELLSVSNEQELDRFLGKFVSGIGRTFKKIGRSGFGRALGGVLRSVAKKALPVLGGAVGSLIPIPGVGTALGAAAANAAGSALGLESEGLSNEDRDFEIARRIVRVGVESARAIEQMPETEFMGEHELGALLGRVASSVAGSLLPGIGKAVVSGLTGQATSGGQATGGLAGGLQVRSPGGWDVRLGGQAGGQVTGGSAVGINAPAPNVPFQPSPPRQVLPYKPGATPRGPWGSGQSTGPQVHGKTGRWIRRGRHLLVLNAY